MISNLFVDLCAIHTKDASAAYGDGTADTFTLSRDNVPCLILDGNGKRVVRTDTGREVAVDRIITLGEAVKPTARIVAGGYEHDILTVVGNRDMMTGGIDHYTVFAVRRRPVSGTTITIL